MANRVESGEQGVELLCSSQRILSDLTRTVLVQQEADESEGGGIKISCIVRRWFAKIAPQLEFRVFVVDRRVVAITQYYKLAFVPEVAEHREHIQQSIISFVEKEINPRLTTVGTYTADVVLAVDNFSDIKLIEINNPPPLAGQALFSWDDPADQAILSGRASGECVMRVLETPPPPDTLLAQIYQPLAPLFNRLRAERHPPASCSASATSSLATMITHLTPHPHRPFSNAGQCGAMRSNALRNCPFWKTTAPPRDVIKAGRGSWR